MPLLRRRDHVLPAGRRGPPSGPDRRHRCARSRSIQAGRGRRRRPAGGARRAARRGSVRLGRARLHRGCVLGRPEAARTPRAGPAGRRGVRRHPLGRAHVPRSHRPPLGLDTRCRRPAPLHREAGAARGPARLGRREVERHVDPARSAAGRRGLTVGRQPARTRGDPAPRARADPRGGRGQPVVRRGDARDADRRRAPSVRGWRVAFGGGPRRRDRATDDPPAPGGAPRPARRRGARSDRARLGRGPGVPRRRGRDAQPRDDAPPRQLPPARTGAEVADPAGSRGVRG